MKPKPTVKYVYDQVYRREVLFIVGCSLAYANTLKELKEYDIILDDQTSNQALGITMLITKDDYPKYTSGAAFLIWIEDRKDLFTLIHEVTHMCIKIFELSNMSITNETTEAFAFYHESWVKRLYDLMNEKTKK
jgi:hypothetical protein